MKKIKSIQADWGLGMLYIEPVPTFHPPSLPRQAPPKMTKLMQRLMKDKEKELVQFRHRLTLKIPRSVSPPVITTFFDNTPLNLPPLFASRNKSSVPVSYNRSKTSVKGHR